MVVTPLKPPIANIIPSITCKVGRKCIVWLPIHNGFSIFLRIKYINSKFWSKNCWGLLNYRCIPKFRGKHLKSPKGSNKITLNEFNEVEFEWEINQLNFLKPFLPMPWNIEIAKKKKQRQPEIRTLTAKLLLGLQNSAIGLHWLVLGQYFSAEFIRATPLNPPKA